MYESAYPTLSHKVSSKTHHVIWLIFREESCPFPHSLHSECSLETWNDVHVSGLLTGISQSIDWISSSAESMIYTFMPAATSNLPHFPSYFSSDWYVLFPVPVVYFWKFSGRGCWERDQELSKITEWEKPGRILDACKRIGFLFRFLRFIRPLILF